MILGIRVRSSVCVLHATLLACSPNFAEVFCTTCRPNPRTLFLFGRRGGACVTKWSWSLCWR